MENRVEEFCLWIIQAIIIPGFVGGMEGWLTGSFEELDQYEDECREMFGRPSREEETAIKLKAAEEAAKNEHIIWKYINGKNAMYVLIFTQVVHLIYAVYIGKQFPVQPLSDFENTNVVWETICLCARDATIQMNAHIIALQIGCRVIYQKSFEFYKTYIKSTTKDDTTDTTDTNGNGNSNGSDGTTTTDSNDSENLFFFKKNNDTEKNNDFWSDITDID